MPLVNHNGEIKNDKELDLAQNRGFTFGDGLFETIIAHNTTPRHFDHHLKRLHSGMHALGLEIDDKDWKKEIHKVLLHNHLVNARIKVMCWRRQSSRPGYSADSVKYDFLMSAQNVSTLKVAYLNHVGLAVKTRLVASPVSQYKTLSSLVYVLAAQERDVKGAEDLILTNVNGFISECCSSNLFWIRDGQLFTPPTSTGCIEGVMRSVIKARYQVIEEVISYNELTNIEAMFSTNVAQLSIHNSFKGNDLNPGHPIIEAIKPLWVL